MLEGRQLIVTADDFGYCKRRNAGIVTCFQAGSVTDTSLLVNGCAALQAAESAQQLGIPTGLHLNLTEGQPVCSGDLVPSLLGKDGHFLGKHGFRQALQSGQVLACEMHREMRAQMEKFLSLMGSRPSHVDGHQHIHVVPAVAEVFATLCEDYGVHWTRLPVEQGLDQCPWMRGKSATFYHHVVQDALQAAPILAAHGVRFPDAYVGLSTMGSDMTVARLQSSLERALALTPPARASPWLVEAMVHPGYPSTVGKGGCGGGPDDFSQSPEREHEMTVLQDKQLHQFYMDHEISLVSFSDL